MLSSVLFSSTQHVHLYPRLRALLRQGAGQPQTGPIYAVSSSSTPTVKWTRHFHKHPTACSTLHHAYPSSSAPSSNTRLPDSSRNPNTTRTMKDPINNRPASPYVNPQVQGPKHQILSSGTQQDLRKTMLTHTVNKTGLHPGGVQYVPPSSLPSLWLYSPPTTLYTRILANLSPPPQASPSRAH